MRLFSDRHRRRESLLGKPFAPAWLDHLQRNVAYYDRLTTAEQSRLRDLLRFVIAEKTWEGCAGFIVTEEVQVTIAAHASLLLLGFEDYCFEELHTVLVYPGGFVTLEEDELNHELQPAEAAVGQAHAHGPVILAWSEVLEDGRQLGDANVVIHEFAHKLAELGDPFAGMPPIDDRKQARQWRRVMAEEYQRLVEDIEAGRPTVIDPYGATNEAEFFAVASESFIVQPVALRQRHPRVYEMLAGWYRQNPVTRFAGTGA